MHGHRGTSLSTSVRIDSSTHEELKRLAGELNTTVGNTVALAVRALRQDRAGADLAAPLGAEDVAWLDADLGSRRRLDLGASSGSEAGFVHPAVLVTAQRILDAYPNVVHVVPLTSTLRRFHSEVVIEVDAVNGPGRLHPAHSVQQGLLGHHQPVGQRRDHRSGTDQGDIAVLLDLPG